MRKRCLKTAITGFLLLVLLVPPLSLGQEKAPQPSAVSLYSIWVRLSLRGYNQEEIESLLRNMDDKAIAEVKNRLRNTVIGNLELKQIGKRFISSRDKDDLRTIRDSIETEVRFAGMQNDGLLKDLIKERFGIVF